MCNRSVPSYNAHTELLLKTRPASVRYLVIALVSLVSIAVLIGIFAARSYTGTAFRIQGVQHLTLDHIFNGTFAAQSRSILWVPEGMYECHNKMVWLTQPVSSWGWGVRNCRRGLYQPCGFEVEYHQGDGVLDRRQGRKENLQASKGSKF